MGSLFLLGFCLLRLSLRALLTDTNKAGLRARITELPEGVRFFYDSGRRPSSFEHFDDETTAMIDSSVNKCVRGCCSSDSIPLSVSKSSTKLDREIARGAESVVYRCFVDGRLVAAKKPRISTSEDLDRFHCELQLLSTLRHPCIATLLFANAHPPDYMFFFKLYENGNLSHALHVSEWSMSQERMLKITFQLGSALHYLHENGIVHRDVKPANILLDTNWDAHLSDFGLAAYVKDLEKPLSSNWKSQGKPTGGFHKKNMVGTLLYMAPEVLNKEIHTEKSDVYAFAICVNEIFTGVVPYTDRKAEAQAHTVLEMNYTEQQLSTAVASEGLRPVLAGEQHGCPPGLSALIEQCWHRDPAQRPSFNYILEKLGKLIKAMGADTVSAVKKNGNKYIEDVNWSHRALDYGDEERNVTDYSFLLRADSSYRPSLSWGVFRARGGREKMEDRDFLLPNVGGTEHIHAFGIFDGHRGYEAAEFASRAVPRFLSASLLRRPSETLSSAFIKTDAAFRVEVNSEKSLRGSSASDWNPGCTATMVLFVNEKLFVANAGDCRTILCRRGSPIALSKDHTASDNLERRRVEQAGGQVKWQMDNWRVGNAGLQVTRSIGDNDLKPGVTAEPEITTLSLTPEDEFLVLATDGLWDTVSNEQAVSLVKHTVKDPGLCAKRLAMEAVERGSSDNITVIVIFLRPVSTVERVY